MGLHEVAHALMDLVADALNDLGGLPSGIVDRPIVSLDSRHVGTFVAAPHRDQQLCLRREFSGELLGAGTTQVNALFLHDREPAIQLLVKVKG